MVVYIWDLRVDGFSQVLTEALGARVLFGQQPNTAEDITATGVEFIHRGTTYVVNSKKEVILSAGYVLMYPFPKVIRH